MHYHLQLARRHLSKHNSYCFSYEIIAFDVFLTAAAVVVDDDVDNDDDDVNDDDDGGDF
jgi:hypothetical protein